MTDLHVDADGKKWERVYLGKIQKSRAPADETQWEVNPVDVQRGDRWVLERPVKEPSEVEGLVSELLITHNCLKGEGNPEWLHARTIALLRKQESEIRRLKGEL